MNEPNKDYLKLVKEKMPKTKHISTMLKAFVVGGLICCVGQAFTDIYTLILRGAAKEDIASLTSITIIFITAVLTGLGIYDKIGEFGGAGSVIPITGFANSVVSAAEEHRPEGIVLGVSTNMFTVAGPVIVFGVSASVVVGIIVLIFRGAFV